MRFASKTAGSRGQGAGSEAQKSFGLVRVFPIPEHERIMRSNRFYRRVGVRLTLWYSAIFIISSVALSIVSYAYLSSSLRDNRKVIRARLEQVVALDRQGGIAAIQDGPAVKRQTSRRKAFFCAHFGQ